MIRPLLLSIALATLSVCAFGQYNPNQVRKVNSLPATCTPGTTTPVVYGAVVYTCTATNTWTATTPGQLPTSTYAGLPTCSSGNDGQLVRVTDANRDIYSCYGTSGTWVSRNGGAYNARDFGAKGDGTTDDTAALQAWLNSASSGAVGTSTVEFILPVGVYKFTAPITYAGANSYGVHLVGAIGTARGGGQNALLKYYGAAGGLGFAIVGGNGSVIEGITVDGNSLAKHGIVVTATNHTNATTTQSITASGTAQTVTVSNTTNMTAGKFINVDSGANVETVEITAVGSGNITALFQKNHSSGITVGNSNPSSGVKLRDITVLGTTGTDSSGFNLGNANTGLTEQISEFECLNCNATGTGAGTEYYGFRIRGTGNIKNFQFVGGGSNGWRYDGYIEAGGTVTFDHFIIGNTTVTNFVTGTNILNLKGIEVESANGISFVTGTTGANPGKLNIIGCSWESVAPSSDKIIDYSGQIFLAGNNFYNNRTASSVAKIYNVGLLSDTGTPASIVSIGNWYANATDVKDVFFDGSGNAVADVVTGGTYGYSHESRVTSLGDLGGSGGALVKFRDVNASGVNSRLNAAIFGTSAAYTGAIRLGNTAAVNFRNAANSGDVNLISSDSSNRTTVGGSAGVLFSYPAVTAASQTGSVSIDLSAGRVHSITFGSGSISSLTVTNIPVGPLWISFTQDGTGSRTITAWNSLFLFAGGTKPTLTTTAGATDQLEFICNGSTCTLVSAIYDVK